VQAGRGKVESELGFHAADISGIYDATTLIALWESAGVENLEERQQETARIDPLVVEYLRDRWRARTD